MITGLFMRLLYSSTGTRSVSYTHLDVYKRQAYNNDGMRASYRASNHSFNLLARNGVRIEGNPVTQNGEPPVSYTHLDEYYSD